MHEVIRRIRIWDGEYNCLFWNAYCTYLLKLEIFVYLFILINMAKRKCQLITFFCFSRVFRLKIYIFCIKLYVVQFNFYTILIANILVYSLQFLYYIGRHWILLFILHCYFLQSKFHLLLFLFLQYTQLTIININCIKLSVPHSSLSVYILIIA